MSFTPNDSNEKITFYFNPVTLKPFIGWAKWFAIVSIIMCAIVCIGVITLPIGILGILACDKLLKICSDLKAIMETGNQLYSEYAGENFYNHFKYMFILCLVYVIFIVAIFAAYVIIASVYSQQIFDFLQEAYGSQTFPGDIEDLSTTFNLLIK